MKNTKEERRREKRNKILDEAGRLFVSNGIESTKIIDIANAAGVAKGTVYEYFESKDDIVIEWMNGIFGEFRSSVEEKIRNVTGAREKLRIFLEESAREFTNIVVNTRVIMQDRFMNICRSNNLERSVNMVADDKIAAIVFENISSEFKLINDIIKEGQCSGEFRKDINIRMIPFLILSLLPFLGMMKQPDFPDELIESRFGFVRPEWNGDEIVSYIVDGIGKKA